MKIPKEVAQRVITGTMQELWDTFITLEGEYKGFEDEYEDVRFGYEVKFEIYDLWEETNGIVRKDKSREVIINEEVYGLEDFRTEKENRRKTMITAILENINEVDVTTPR